MDSIHQPQDVCATKRSSDRRLGYNFFYRKNSGVRSDSDQPWVGLIVAIEL